MTNLEIADLLRSVAAAYSLKGISRFQILAYETASEGIDHATNDIVDLWKQGGVQALENIPGVGKSIAAHLDELFKKGNVAHFEEILKDYPEGMFSLLKVPGVGPKTALKLSQIGVDDFRDLRLKLEKRGLEGKVTPALMEKLKEGMQEYLLRSNRMLLPTAQEIADSVVNYLKKADFIVRAETLGSLRRKVATIGDIDIAVATDEPEKVAPYIQSLLILREIVEKGESSLTLSLKNGVRVDVMTQPVRRFGALLQHFTGSKHHNIKLRTLAQEKGYSLSEYGVKDLKTGKQIEIPSEEKLYNLLHMSTPAPEIREDSGEIEQALKKSLPKLVELTDIKGDLHSHSIWSDGHNTVKEMAQKAKTLGYKYFACTDHSYPSLDYSKRINQIEQYNDSDGSIRVIIGLEVNINADGSLQFEDSILEKHELNLASIHTSFRQDRDTITKRLINAISNPLINGIAHPTGRLLLQRSSVDIDWEQIFNTCKKYYKFL